MKKPILFLSLVFLSFLGFTQKPDLTLVATLDSTITKDMKLLITTDRLYSKNGLFDALSNQISLEKANDGESPGKADINKFAKKVENAYQELVRSFIKVGTVFVNLAEVNKELAEIQEWQTKVLNDPEIKKATTLSIWEQKQARLEQLAARKKNVIK